MATMSVSAGEAASSEGEAVRREVALGGGTLSVLDFGGDGPPLHFAHANGFNGLTYRRLLAPLTRAFRITAWDARGHGRSQLPADPGTHSNWLVYRDDLIAYLETVVAAEGAPVILGGHSMGGTTSILAAAERPDLVAGLFLIEPVMIPRGTYRLMMHLSRLGIGKPGLAEGAEKRKAVWPDRETMINVYRPRGIFRSWPGEMVADYVEGGTLERSDGQVELACKPAWEAANFRAHGHDIWAAVKRLNRPISVLYAGIASTTREGGATALKRSDPRATIMYIGRASHFLPMEMPETVARELISFKERLSAEAAAARASDKTGQT